MTTRNRKLEEDSEVWTHNSWDNVAWSPELASSADAVISAQLAISPHLANPDAVSEVVQTPASQNWHKFYENHSRWFFKDRKWLSSEFPELFVVDNVLEVGCGAGNTVFPLARENPTVMIHACDFAPSAVQLVKEFREYDEKRMHVFQHDLSSPEPFEDIPENSIDVVVSIFVLSALDPAKLPIALEKIWRVLKPGGMLLFRDYGKYDMTQLRFKANRLIRPDLYVRGDGTAVHYFTEEEISVLADQTGFEMVSNTTDRRLLVNRHRKLTMYRIWVQSKLQKPIN